MAQVAIIGSGVVGQATGAALHKQGHQVIFSDINKEKLESLSLQGYKVSSPEELSKERVDVFFVAVPTPTREGSGVDLSYLKEAMQTIGAGPLRTLSTYPIIVVKSTIPPGTIQNLVVPTLEAASEKKNGKDFGVAFEPEYLREKNATEDALAPRRLLIGSSDPHSGHVLAWLRFSFHAPITQVTPEAAELQKYAHNLWNATKISFFNEMREVAKKLEIKDIDELFATVVDTAEASWNPLYGTRDFGPYDGMCLPKDTAGFLHWAEQEMRLSLPLLRGVIEVNEKLKAKEAPASEIPPTPPLASENVENTEKKPFPSALSFQPE